MSERFAPSCRFRLLGLLLVAAAWVCCLVPGSATAQGPTVTAPTNPQTIRAIYGFDREFPPFSFERDGEPAGFDVDLLRAALAGRDVELTMRPMDWERVQLDLSGGVIQLTSGMAKTPQRELLYQFSQLPTAPLKVRLYTRLENRVANVRQLRGRAVSVQDGSLYERILMEYGGLNVKDYPTEHAALRALAEGDVDAFGGADKTASYYIEKLSLRNVTPVGTPLRVASVFFAGSQDAQELMSRLNAGLWNLYNSGEYATLYRKWFVRELDPREMERMFQAATNTLVNAYAPYTQNPKAAAVLGASGAIYTGVSVENRQPGLSASALRVASQNAIASGETVLRAAVELDAEGRVLTPLGDDLQILAEFGQETLVITQPTPDRRETRTLLEMMPYPVSDMMISPALRGAPQERIQSP